jgi:hypothetical protein
MRRQLLKLMVTAEAARSIMLYTAVQLEAADTGDEAARRRVRLLTPLLKFRACRDARRVTGDAMEVRGGIGYIEEWSDARLVRDAHLGSIWEGTSNIVALDAMRAIRREDALDALQPSLEEMTPPGTLRKAVTRACAFAREVSRTRDDAHARQAASGLYYAAACAILASEGERLGRTGDARRSVLAALVHEHRLRARDPLRTARGTLEKACADALLPETPVAGTLAEKLVASLQSKE